MGQHAAPAAASGPEQVHETQQTTRGSAIHIRRPTLDSTMKLRKPSRVGSNCGSKSNRARSTTQNKWQPGPHLHMSKVNSTAEVHGKPSGARCKSRAAGCAPALPVAGQQATLHQSTHRLLVLGLGGLPLLGRLRLGVQLHGVVAQLL